MSTTEAACRLLEGDRLSDIIAAAVFAGTALDVDAVLAEVEESTSELN